MSCIATGAFFTVVKSTGLIKYRFGSRSTTRGGNTVIPYGNTIKMPKMGVALSTW